jgi:elongation factor Ts
MATKKASRQTKQGHIEAYIHHGGKIGVLLEVDCETDFVAKNEDFKKFAKDIAMQIAAACPRYISREEVPVSVLESERDIIKASVEKFYQQACLLEQPFIRDEKVFIKDLLAALVGKIGENIIIKRFVRFQVGVE